MTRRTGFLTGLAAVLLMPAPSPAEDGLGRLFTSQEQRRQLDASRNGRARAPVAETAPRPARPARAPNATVNILLKGLVYRPDGNNTAWINSGNTYEANADNGYPAIKNSRIGADSITVTPPGRSAIILRVGERLGSSGPAEQAPP